MSMSEFRKLLNEKCGMHVCARTLSRYVDLLITVLSDDDLAALSRSPSLRHKAIKELQRRKKEARSRLFLPEHSILALALSYITPVDSNTYRVKKEACEQFNET